MQLSDSQIIDLNQIYSGLEREFADHYRVEFVKIYESSGSAGVIEAFKAAKTKREQAVYWKFGRMNGIRAFYLEEERKKYGETTPELSCVITGGGR